MTPEIPILGSFLVALFAALFVIPKLAHIANRIGLVDRPNERKTHRVPRPLVGGIGIVICATFSGLLFVPLHGLRGFFAGLAVLLLVGFFDDFLEVGHRKKFLAQIFATALLISLSQVSLHNFGDLLGLGDIEVASREWLVWAVTIFCVVGVTNAVNMIDGLDGLAGGVAFIAFISFTVLASLAGNLPLVLLNLSLAGAVLGFLRFNWSPAILFMGDAGSLCLGFSLSFMSIALTQPEGAIIKPVAALLVMAVPIADTITVMVRRILARRSPFSPDRTHLHHVILGCGLESKTTVTAILFLCACFGALAVLGEVYSIPEPLLFAIFLVYFLGNYFSARPVAMVISALRSLQRKEKPRHCPGIVHSVFHSFFGRRIFRGAKRYRVQLGVTCTSYSSNFALAGTILNVSRTGFMAQIEELGFFCKECVIIISLPGKGEMMQLELPAEHLWSATIDKQQYHGFRFLDLDQRQEAVLTDFINHLRDAEQLP